MPKISVIVPVYNTEPKYIDAALRSLFNQTLSDLEIIVVNDGSTDKATCKYLDQIATDSRLKIINQSNMGLSGARNSALDISNGDFVGFLDSDDWLDKDFYAKLYRKCIDNKADIACGVLRVCEKNQEFNLDNFGPLITDDPKTKVANITNGSVCSKLFKRSLFDDVRFPDGLYYEDNLTLLELMLRSKNVAFVPNVHYNYRSTPTGIIHNKSGQGKRIRDSVIILEKIKKIADTYPKTQRNAIINTFLQILLMVKVYNTDPDYKNSMDKIFGEQYLKPFVSSGPRSGVAHKIINKIKRFFFRVQNGRVKIFKLTVYKIKG